MNRYLWGEILTLQFWPHYVFSAFRCPILVSCAHFSLSFLLFGLETEPDCVLLRHAFICYALWHVFLLTSAAQRGFQGASMAFPPV